MPSLGKRGDGVRMLSDARVQFKIYNNAVFKYAVNTFKLNVSQLGTAFNGHAIDRCRPSSLAQLGNGGPCLSKQLEVLNKGFFPVNPGSNSA